MCGKPSIRSAASDAIVPGPRTEHGIRTAFYTNGPYGTNPMLVCLCGFETSPANNSWHEAGLELDDHLLDVKEERLNGKV